MDLVNILEEYYPESNLKAARLTRMSPTRIVKCPRGAFMDSLGYGEPIEFTSDINFGYGTMRHERIQGVLEHMGVLKETELWVEMDDPPIGGFIDGILDTEPESILEIKTTGKSLASLDLPLQDHIDQAMLYMHIHPAKLTQLLYEAKAKDAKLRWRQFEVEYDEERAEKLLKKARSLLRNLDNKCLPLPGSNCWRCNNPYCFDMEVHKKEGLI